MLCVGAFASQGSYCRRFIKEILLKCVICRRVQGKPFEQLMADLLIDRLTADVPPFTSCGTDYFGPYLVVRGRGKSREKLFGVVFTCLSSRAVHTEVANSLDTDSFINCLRRFIRRRGPVKLIRSDNGTNFAAGNEELRKNSIISCNQSQINDKCRQRGMSGNSSLRVHLISEVYFNVRYVVYVRFQVL